MFLYQRCNKCYMKGKCNEAHLNYYKKPLHSFIYSRFWEGFTPVCLEDNLIFRPYLYNKVRFFGKLDMPLFLSLRYKTQDYQRLFI